MVLNTHQNSVSLKFDARNKDPKSFTFDKVCDGTVD